MAQELQGGIAFLVREMAAYRDEAQHLSEKQTALRAILRDTLDDLLLTDVPTPAVPSAGEEEHVSARAAPGPRSRAAGGRLHYREWRPSRPASTPPVILVHGLSGNAHNFDALTAKIGDRYHLDSLGLREAILIGAGLGADVALGLTSARPGLVRGLVLNDTGPEAGRDGSAVSSPPAASVSACTTPPSSRCAALPTPTPSSSRTFSLPYENSFRPSAAASPRSSPRPPAPTPTRPHPGPARRSARSHDRSAAAAPPDLPPADDWRTTAPAPPPTGSR